MDTVLDMLQQVADRQAILYDKRSELDKWISNYYHIVECVPMSASEASKLYKKFKEVLSERRHVKNDIALLASINFIPNDQLKYKLTKNRVNIREIEEKAVTAYSSLLKELENG